MYSVISGKHADHKKKRQKPHYNYYKEREDLNKINPLPDKK